MLPLAQPLKGTGKGVAVRGRSPRRRGRSAERPAQNDRRRSRTPVRHRDGYETYPDQAQRHHEDVYHWADGTTATLDEQRQCDDDVDEPPPPHFDDVDDDYYDQPRRKERRKDDRQAKPNEGRVHMAPKPSTLVDLLSASETVDRESVRAFVLQISGALDTPA